MRGEAGRPSGDPLALVSASGAGAVPPQHSRDAWWWSVALARVDSEACSANTVTQTNISCEFEQLISDALPTSDQIRQIHI